MFSGSPQTPDLTHPLNTEELEEGLLYAVLSYRGEVGSWNWAFYVPDPSIAPIGSKGMMYHVIEDASDGIWKFEVGVKEALASPETIAIVRLSDISFLGGYKAVVGSDSLLPMFKTVAVPTVATANFSSRSWFLDAICTLHDCGVVQCDDVWLLEREIRRCAFTAMDKYLENKGQYYRFTLPRVSADQNMIRLDCVSIRSLWVALAKEDCDSTVRRSTSHSQQP